MRLKLRWHSPPRSAKWCYGIGFLLIIAGLFIQLTGLEWLSVRGRLLVFLAGAIVVTLGSMINSWHQFKPRNKNG